MADSIAHRGPDDEGYFLLAPWVSAFAGCRLSILPVGISRCPTPEKSVWIVFNGEIYNFKELRAELEQRGHRFRTQLATPR